MKTADAILSLITYLHDPQWKPTHWRGYNYSKSMGWFRCCTPVNVIQALEPPSLFTDATLDLAGVSRHAAFSLSESGLPTYACLRRARLPQRYRRTAGVSHILYRAGEVPGHPGKCYGCEHGVTQHHDRWIVAPIIDQRVEGGIDPSAGPAAMAVAGVAFNERYSAHMEVDSGNGTSVALPLNLPQLRQVLADRDKPETGDRRPALIHLVSAHLRATADERVQVREHLRGRISCMWRGWAVILHPAVYDTERLTKDAK